MDHSLFLAASNEVMRNVLTWGGILAVFYFILIRPQQKERKNQERLRTSLEKGHEVLLQGGIMGRVHAVKDKEIVLDIDGARMRVLKESVLRRIDDDAGKGAPAKKDNDRKKDEPKQKAGA